MKKRTFIKHFRSVILAIILVFSAACISIIEHHVKKHIPASKIADVPFNDFTIVIDAGHGGEDGGTVGTSGSLEKVINLEISKRLESLFNLADIKVVMTRTDDRLLYYDGQENQKKHYDVRNRTSLVAEIDNPILISIHQNSFPVSKYYGLQVYYSQNNSLSSNLADEIQSFAKKHLQPENNRKIKPSGRNIYILNKVKCPAVLIECGFLSNVDEEKMLVDPEYQQKVAFTIFSATMNFIKDTYKP